MPYKITKDTDGYHVVNTETGQRKNKKPLSHAAARKFQQALYANVPEASQPK